jgi:drug/metabolite transporter (DMT)-like permease
MKLRVVKPGVTAALGAALLFGGGTPLAKLLLQGVNPWLLAGMLYLGAGSGLTLYRLFNHRRAGKLEPEEWKWLAGAILFGGVAGPVLLLFGLKGLPASGASLLLNTEGVFTALLAWFLFRENFDRRIVLGMIAIVGGAIVISWPGDARFSTVLPALAVVGACLSWSIDNNLTCKISHCEATWIASVKGFAAGGINLGIAILSGADWPAWTGIGAMLLVGCFSFGISLVLFVTALRQLGTARTGAYFSVAPFFGAVLAVPLLGETVDGRLIIAGTLMALGIWLHLTERHEHEHFHEIMAHEHVHDPDCLHHQHEHDKMGLPLNNHHRHRHGHAPLAHLHDHFPDTHHRHEH